MTVKQAFEYGIDYLNEHNSENSRFEVKELLSFCLGISAHKISFFAVNEIEDDKFVLFKSLLEKRVNHIPLQYIIGEWEFYGLTFKVGEGVLIPRPETETLVDICLKKSKQFINPVILDLCSGSGCIAITLAKLLPHSHVYAVEKYNDAFSYLEKNIALHSLNNITALQGDIFDSSLSPVIKQPDIIVSNPPYIISAEIDSLQLEVQKEPITALDGGYDGLDFYRAIHNNFSISPFGMFAFESGEGQPRLICDLFFGYDKKQIIKDVYGVERFVTVER